MIKVQGSDARAFSPIADEKIDMTELHFFTD